MDNNVHPANTYRVVDALIRANKRFDFHMIPGKRHGYADAGDWVFWMRADYFAGTCSAGRPTAPTCWNCSERWRSADKKKDLGFRFTLFVKRNPRSLTP